MNDNDELLFDLNTDPIDVMVDIIAETVPLDRFEELHRAMARKLAQLKRAQR
jgi:hypothetical protein